MAAMTTAPALSGTEAAEDIIILPTYPPHFGCARAFLEQYAEYVEPEERVPVCVVFSSPQECSDFAAFVADGAAAAAAEKMISYRCHVVERVPALDNKFLVQCFKKFDALQRLSYRRALIIDSDTAVLNKSFSPRRMLAADLGARLIYRHKNCQRDEVVVRNTRHFFGFDDAAAGEQPAMYFEQPWIIVKAWVSEFFDWWLRGRQLFDVMNAMPRDLTVFEILAYYEYLVRFKSEEVVVLDSDDVMAKHGVDVRSGQMYVNFNYVYQYAGSQPVEKLADIVRERGIVMICGNDDFIRRMMEHDPEICIRLHVDRPI
jgi:hypothetical protein